MAKSCYCHAVFYNVSPKRGRHRNEVRQHPRHDKSKRACTGRNLQSSEKDARDRRPLELTIMATVMIFGHNGARAANLTLEVWLRRGLLRGRRANLGGANA